MRKHLIYLFLLCILGSSALRAQKTQSIRGVVYDAEVGFPLPGASILLLTGKENTGTTTDDEGSFCLEHVSLGRHSVLVTYLGYEDVVVPEILVNAGKQVVLEIKLTESLTQLDEVVVKAEVDKNKPLNPIATVSARMFTVEETKRYPGSFDDPSRMAASFAGVSQDDDINNALVIRGNSPRGMLWRLEGVDIPNPNHFAEVGNSGGGVGMLSSNMMANSDFYTGAFPANFGNATSGAFDINLRKGNNEKREYAFQIGLLGTDFALEGPLKKGYSGSYLLNYRYSTLGILNAVGLTVVGDAVPTFQDLSFKVWLPSKNAGSFSLFGLGGISFIEEEWDDLGLLYNDESGSNTGILGLSHNYILSEKAYIKTTVAVTRSDILYKQWEQDTLIGHTQQQYDELYKNSSIRLVSNYHYKLNTRNYFQAGIILSSLGFNYNVLSYNDESDFMQTDIKDSDRTFQAQAFANWRHRFNEKVTLNTGVHYLYFHFNKNQVVEPRIGVTFEIKKGSVLSFGAGLHSRVEDLSIYTARTTLDNGSVVRPNRDLGLQKAAHLVWGFDQRIGNSMRLKAEIYYQHLYNVPVWLAPDDWQSALNARGGYTVDPLVNQGTGMNYGLELTLEKFFSDNYYFLITGSLFESKYKGLDGIKRNTTFNTNYLLNALAGKEFEMGKNRINRLGISLRAVYRGGQRVSPILLEESIKNGETVRDHSRAYEEQADPYFRIDFQCYYNINKSKLTHQVKLDFQNATNRLNAWYSFYDADTQSIETNTFTGMIPVLSYKIIF